MRLKRLAAALFAVLAAGGLAGCAGTESGGGEGDRPKAALIVINQQAIFFKQLVAGAKKAAADQGVDLTVFNANDDAAEQNTAVETYTQQGFDTVIVNPIDAEGIRPALRTAKEGGTNVVTVDASLQDANVSTQVGVDNRGAGEQIGRFFDQWADQEGIRGARIGEVAALNSSVQVARQRGFEGAVKQAGHRIAQVVDGKNVQDDALQAAEDLITSQGARMTAVYATGEPAMLGTIAAAKSQGATRRLKLFGWDLTKEVIAGIDAGNVVGVVQQDPYTEGVRAVQTARQLADGKTPPKRIDVPITIVTPKNVDRYRSTFR